MVRSDAELMARALQLAESARRRTPPWPWVGCVLARDGSIVGEGATGPYPTGPHAEVVALRTAGDRGRGATAFVTLEPCNHDGNTPPCTDALLAAGVTRVVAALEDPDPKVAGRGAARLRDAGVAVEIGLEGERVSRSLAPYLHQRRTGRAFCVLKSATSLDGRTAAADGTSRWITGPDARRDAHGLRADSQAVVVGAGTALVDQPTLTARDVEPAVERQALRVLLDAAGRVPTSGPLFDVLLAPTLVVTTERAAPGAVDAWRAAGAKVECVEPARGRDGVDLRATLELLAGHGVLQCLVEGGAHVHGALVDAGLADRLVVYVAPVVLGERGQPALRLDGPATMADTARWRLVDVTRLGDDVRLDYEPAEH